MLVYTYSKGCGTQKWQFCLQTWDFGLPLPAQERNSSIKMRMEIEMWMIKILVVEDRDKYLLDSSSPQHISSLIRSLLYIFPKLLYIKLSLKILNYYKYILTLNIYLIIFFKGMRREKYGEFFQWGWEIKREGNFFNSARMENSLSLLTLYRGWDEDMKKFWPLLALLQSLCRRDILLHIENFGLWKP